MAKTIDLKSVISPLFSGHTASDPQYKPLKLTPSLIKNLGLIELEGELKKHGILLSDALTTRMTEGSNGPARFAAPGVWYSEDEGYYLLFGLGRANGDYKFPLPATTRLYRNMESGRYCIKIGGVSVQVNTGLSWDDEDQLDDLISVEELPQRELPQGGSGGFAKSLAKLCLALEAVDTLEDILDVTLVCKSEPVMGNGKYPKYEILGEATVMTKGGETYFLHEQKLEITGSVALKLMQLWEGEEVTITLAPALTKDKKAYLQVK